MLKWLLIVHKVELNKDCITRKQNAKSLETENKTQSLVSIEESVNVFSDTRSGKTRLLKVNLTEGCSIFNCEFARYTIRRWFRELFVFGHLLITFEFMIFASSDSASESTNFSGNFPGKQKLSTHRSMCFCIPFFWDWVLTALKI
jgi:hypothetical protein